MLAPEIEARLLGYLKEDIGSGDLTASITPSKECLAQIMANEPCLVAGIEEVCFLMRSMGLKANPKKVDGEAVKKGGIILEVFGDNRKMLSLERVCLNILGRMSGVATMCIRAKMVAEKETIAVTRKTIPGFQLLDKKAAQAAGAWSHRKNLAEMILLKDNHLKFFPNAFEAAKAANETGKKFEIEVQNEGEAISAAKAYPDIIMLDNFSPKQARKAIKGLRKNGFMGQIELSGGITLKNLKGYSNIGADIISMGELTKKAKIIDFSMDIMEVKN